MGEVDVVGKGTDQRIAELLGQAKARASIEYRVVRGHTLMIGANEVIPEDALFRRDNPGVPAFACLQDDRACHCGWGCVPKLAARLVWLFDRMPKVEQVFVLFKRGERDLVRVVPGTDGRDPSGRPRRAVARSPHDERRMGEVKPTVPRMWAIWVPRDFGEAPQPYRVMRVNWDGVRLSLERSSSERIEVPFSFWSGPTGADLRK